jgi:23S rRNA pseudouridine1911/1915/1917 synthase
MAVRPDGRPAITHWSIAETYAGRDGTPAASLIACRLETGRTHQIRVHLAHIGHPVLGDPTYGRGFATKRALLGPAGRAAVAHLERQALHAHLLGFDHPATRRFLEFRSELPGDLSRLHHGLRQGALRGAPGSC